MTAGVIVNADKDPERSYTREVCSYLKYRNVSFSIDDFNAKADFWVVLGGDGTMLRASHRAAVLGVPMLGINLGNLGYLTDADRQDGISAVAKFLDGNYVKESRLMLETEAGIALNDVYFSRETDTIVTFNLEINGLYIDTFRADGIIISTPTGSTAYNLSAGGPILMPEGNMMVITAVCPHTLHVRPWVVSADDEVRVTTAGKAVCSLDGEAGITVNAGEPVTVKSSAHRAEIVRTSSPHFYEVLRRKLTGRVAYI